MPWLKIGIVRQIKSRLEVSRGQRDGRRRRRVSGASIRSKRLRSSTSGTSEKVGAMHLLVRIQIGVLVPGNTIGTVSVVLALAEHDVFGLGRHIKLVDEHLARLLSVTVPERNLGHGVFVSSDPVHFSVRRRRELVANSGKEKRIDIGSKGGVSNSRLAKSDNQGVSSVDLERNTVQKCNSSSKRVSSDHQAIIRVHGLVEVQATINRLEGVVENTHETSMDGAALALAFGVGVGGVFETVKVDV